MRHILLRVNLGAVQHIPSLRNGHVYVSSMDPAHSKDDTGKGKLSIFSCIERGTYRARYVAETCAEAQNFALSVAKENFEDSENQAPM